MASIGRQASHRGAARSGLLCIDCHDPHAMKPMKEEKKRDERRYCLSCHGRKGLAMKFEDGSSLSLFIDEGAFSSSSHGRNRCTFCHEGFSVNYHPKRSYKTKREFSLTLAPRACARCHAEECKRYERCVHGAVLKRARELAPTCTDCHPAHAVRIEKEDKALNLLKCKECHKAIYGAYEQGVHFKAWQSGRRDVPLCTGCHRPHEVSVKSFNVRNSDVCLYCHRNAKTVHVGWFHNPPFKVSSFVKFHLQSITCNVCHAPQAGGAVYLHPYEKAGRSPILVEEVTKVLKVDRQGLKAAMDKNRDCLVDARELWALFADLLGEGRTLTLVGWMDVRDPVSSHTTKPKGLALRSCETCHRHDSPFFRDAFVLFRDQYGWPEAIRVHKDVLSTKSALSPLSEFYAFGSTRIKLVDLFLVLAVCLAALVPVGHILLRLATRALRRRSR